MRNCFAAGVVGLWLLASGAVAEDSDFLEHCFETDLGLECERRFFVVDKDGAALFDGPGGDSLHNVGFDGAVTAPGCAVNDEHARTPSMGEVFFARAEANGRVLVGRVYAGCLWEPIGWMRRVDLLEGRSKALTIGEFAKLQSNTGRALDVRLSQNEGGLSGQEYRLLRLVNHPERGSRLGTRPSDASGEPVFDWRWYYVYDLEAGDGQSWLLVGDRPRLLGTPRFEDTTKQDGPKNVLLGWLPADTVAIWASNLALELNTDPAAVAYRVRERDSATVLCRMRDASGRFRAGMWNTCKNENMTSEDHAWTEQLGEMWTATGQATEQYRLILDIDPMGLNPSVPRLHIVQSWEGDYLEIASSSATGGLVLADISYLLLDVAQAAVDLRKVDIVFVVDSTGSMADEIAAVSTFLQRIADRLSVHATGTTHSFEVVRGRSLDLLGGLDITLGLVGFQDIAGANHDRGEGCPGNTGRYEARTFFSGRRLASREDMIEIRGNLAALSSQLSGSCEALHEGLLEALGSKHFRDGTLDRMIIVIADEPGNSRRLNDVLAAMPVPTEKQLRGVSKWQGLSGVELKRGMTTIFAIYVGERGHLGFKKKLGPLVSDSNLRRFGPVSPTSEELFIDMLDTRIEQKKRNITKEISAYREALRGSGQKEFDALPGLGQFKLREAMARANLTPERIDELNEVAFFDGFVHRSDVAADAVVPGGIDAKARATARPASWRVRVLMNRDELMQLHRHLDRVVHGIEHALRETDNIPPWLRDKDRKETRRELIARFIVLLVDHTIYDEGFFSGEDGQKALEAAVKDFLKRLDAGDSYMNQQLRFVMKLQAHLPVRTDGLLSLTLVEAAGKTRGWYKEQLHILRGKALGLDNILRDLSVPEDPQKVETTDTVPKIWFGRLGTSSIEFAYVPIGYVP